MDFQSTLFSACPRGKPSRCTRYKHFCDVQMMMYNVGLVFMKTISVLLGVLEGVLKNGC